MTRRERAFIDVDRPVLLEWAAKHVLPPQALLLGDITVGRLEIITEPDYSLAQKISAKLWLIIEEAREQLIAPTLPVHDEPMSKALRA